MYIISLIHLVYIFTLSAFNLNVHLWKYISYSSILCLQLSSTGFRFQNYLPPIVAFHVDSHFTYMRHFRYSLMRVRDVYVWCMPCPAKSVKRIMNRMKTEFWTKKVKTQQISIRQIMKWYPNDRVPCSTFNVSSNHKLWWKAMSLT